MKQEFHSTKLSFSYFFKINLFKIVINPKAVETSHGKYKQREIAKLR